MRPDSQVVERVRRIFADVLNIPFDTLAESSSPESIPTWDSLQHLNLMLAIEEDFGVQFDPEQAERLTTLGQFAEIAHALTHKTKAR